MTTHLLSKAETYCLIKGHRFTEPRAQVLQILLRHQKPMTAYEVLDKLAVMMKDPKPPTVYRAIKFWHEQGFIHCIDSLNAYIACQHEHHIGQAQFLICNNCDYIKELHQSTHLENLMQAADENQFTAKQITIEIKGNCSDCS